MTDRDYQPCSQECNGCPTCDPGLRNQSEPTRLSVLVNEDCANYVDSQINKGETATEVVRQALALHKFVNDGGRVLTAETVAAIDSLTGDCFISQQGAVRCTEWVGASFPNGETFTEDACCLPCRVRSLVGRSVGAW